MKKLNNKTLILIFLGLIGIFVLVRLFRTPALESNLKKELVAIDTSKVTLIKVWPGSDNGGELQFVKGTMRWTLKKGDKQYNIEQGSANGLLAYAVKLAPQKMVTRKKEKWEDYQVGDSSTRVQFLADGKVMADVRIGRVGFDQNEMQRMQQQQQQGSPFGGQGAGGFGGAFTYVRLEGEDEVYTVDGFLESSFNRSLNDWRDKSLLRIKKEQVTKVSFNYPDSGFVADRRENKWWIGTAMADSTKFKSYLNQLEYKNASAFADDFTPSRQPDISLNIDGAAGPLATIQAWKRETDWVVTSTQQAGVYFSTEGSGIFNTVFEKGNNLRLMPGK
jgi:Domain of unknown function (DUF4340)